MIDKDNLLNEIMCNKITIGRCGYAEYFHAFRILNTDRVLLVMDSDYLYYKNDTHNYAELDVNRVFY